MPEPTIGVLLHETGSTTNCMHCASIGLLVSIVDFIKSNSYCCCAI